MVGDVDAALSLSVPSAHAASTRAPTATPTDNRLFMETISIAVTTGARNIRRPRVRPRQICLFPVVVPRSTVRKPLRTSNARSVTIARWSSPTSSRCSDQRRCLASARRCQSTATSSSTCAASCSRRGGSSPDSAPTYAPSSSRRRGSHAPICRRRRAASSSSARTAVGYVGRVSKPLRTVTCRGCERRFRPARADARYCSDACRQAAHRARRKGDPTDREIEEARVRYWRLIEQRALARGASRSQVVTGEAQYVDLDGTVWMGAGPDGRGGRYAGRITPDRPGWAGWGLEAAGPPWSPPPGGSRRPGS